MHLSIRNIDSRSANSHTGYEAITKDQDRENIVFREMRLSIYDTSVHRLCIYDRFWGKCALAFFLLKLLREDSKLCIL